MDRLSGFAADIEAQKKTIRTAKSRKGQSATNKQTRHEIAADYDRVLGAAEHHLRTCVIPPAYPPSTASVSTLKPIALSDLRLETHHSGRVLLARTFTNSKRIVSVQVGIEDEFGNVDHLALYNADPKLPPAQVLQKDAVYAIKEPYYKASAAGSYIVRVDHPSDLIKLTATHEVVPLALQPRLVELDISAEARKLDGNQAYKEKNYLSALDQYSQGLLECEQDAGQLRSDLLRNRAIVNLFLRRYDSAAKDALASIPSDEDASNANILKKCNAKAYHRAGCAMYHQEKFKEALDCFTKSLAAVPGDSDCQREIKKTQCRLRENKNGDYDLNAMSTEASPKRNRLDHASFLANVEVRQTQNRGRGLFNTTDLKAGDLIICEKAFCVAFHSDNETATYTLLNINTNSGAIGTQATLLFSLTQKLLHDHAGAVKFFNLYDGTKVGHKQAVHQADGVTVVDTFRAAAIREYNAFGCPDLPSTEKPQVSEADTDPRSASGVWITASYANHGCDGNAARSYIGDFMIVRATKDIAKGTEITMPYRFPEWDVSETRKALQKAWGFKCDCDVCVVESQISGPQVANRRQLSMKVQTFLKSNVQNAIMRPSKDTIAKAQKLYEQMEATYDKKLFEHAPRLALIDLSLWLLSAQQQNPVPTTVISKALEILRNCGFGIELNAKALTVDYSHCFMHFAAVDAAVHAAQCHYAANKFNIGKQFEEFAKKLYTTRCGTSVGFAERYD